ncbi:MAG: IS66 family transposase, partial [Pseudomonadota bacterium]
MHGPSHCSCCGREIKSDELELLTGSRQVFDLPEPRLLVTAHRLGRVVCCGVEQVGEYPAEVRTVVQYGSGVRALSTLLSVQYRLPLAQISELFNDLYGYELNSTTILDTLSRGHHLSASLEQGIKGCLRSSPVLHFDETGIRVEGKLHWLHTVSTADYTHLFVHPKRGREALESEASVIDEYKGIAVNDCWASYFCFEDCQHALCGAHLLRELTGLIENGSQWANKMHLLLMQLYYTSHSGPLEWPLNYQTLLDYQAILKQANEEEPPPLRSARGKPKQSKGRNLYQRLKQHQAAVLRFAFEAAVPFTNNQAERDVRGTKVKLKIAGSFRTLSGAKHHVRLQALISTWRKQQHAVFKQLRNLF